MIEDLRREVVLEVFQFGGVHFCHIPAYTRRCFDVVSTSFYRYGRQMDVETTLCAYWDPPVLVDCLGGVLVV